MTHSLLLIPMGNSSIKLIDLIVQKRPVDQNILVQNECFLSK